WGPMHWGHARSRDLVTWEHLPIAMAPEMEKGEGGVWSGSAGVRGDAPWKTLPELVDDARKNPGKIKFASAGVGSTQHATVMEILFRDDLRMIHVPYKGSIEAATAVLGGHADFAALTSEFVPMVRAGQARILAMASEKRVPMYPDVPTMMELGYDYANDSVFAVLASAQIDPVAAGKIEKAFRTAAKDKEYLEALDRISMLPAFYDDKAFDAFMRKHWKRINRQLKAADLIQEAATQPE
ncbi:MAG: tripartite tricarboxylate transporter substrate-binding protein, partial [Smithellaceae bacterium]